MKCLYNKSIVLQCLTFHEIVFVAILQEFTSARYVRLRFQKIRTLNAHLMSLQSRDPRNLDPSVTRRVRSLLLSLLNQSVLMIKHCNLVFFYVNEANFSSVWYWTAFQPALDMEDIWCCSKKLLKNLVWKMHKISIFFSQCFTIGIRFFSSSVPNLIFS